SPRPGRPCGAPGTRVPGGGAGPGTAPPRPDGRRAGRPPRSGWAVRAVAARSWGSSGGRERAARRPASPDGYPLSRPEPRGSLAGASGESPPPRVRLRGSASEGPPPRARLRGSASVEVRDQGPRRFRLRGEGAALRHDEAALGPAVDLGVLESLLRQVVHVLVLALPDDLVPGARHPDHDLVGAGDGRVERGDGEVE